jgi:hypothetical protein
VDNAARFGVEPGRTRADLIGSIACLADAFVCTTFLFLPATPENVGLLCIVLLADQITCIIGYCAMYRRLLVTNPKLAELGFYLLISGTLFLTCHNIVEESARLSFFTLNYSTANAFNILLEILVTSTLPVGLAIYAWLIASNLTLHRWLGFMMGVQVVLLFIALGFFAFPWLGDFMTAELITVYAIILSVAKAVWFLSPVSNSKRHAL